MAENEATMLSRYVQETRIKYSMSAKSGMMNGRETVQGKLEFAQDLHAADAVYHQACSANFQTGKQITRKHGNDTDSKPAKGHPTDTLKCFFF